MPFVLECAHPLERDPVPDVDVRRGDVDPELDAQRTVERELPLEPAFREDVDGVAGEIGDRHGRPPIRTRTARVRERQRVPGAEHDPAEAEDRREPGDRRAGERRAEAARQIVIETAVNAASSTSATSAYDSESIVAIRSSPTPALLPIPARARRGTPGAGPHAVAVRGRSNSPRRQRTSSETARATIITPTVVSAPCCSRSGRNAWKSTIGRPNKNSVSPCRSPTRGRAERRRRAGLVRGERRERGEVVRIGRVAQAEQDGDERDDEQAGADGLRRHVVVETEHVSSFQASWGSARAVMTTPSTRTTSALRVGSARMTGPSSRNARTRAGQSWRRD